MRILIADDDIDIREMVTSMLESEGISCKAFECGSRVIQEVDRNPDKYDCIILDFQMGGLDGIQTAEMIKRINSDIPIIMITGAPSIETEIKARIAGVDCFLEKPFMRKSLLTAIRSVVKNEINSSY